MAKTFLYTGGHFLCSFYPLILVPDLRKLEKLRFSHVQLFATLWTVARQAPLSVGFSRQEYWTGLPFPSPGDLPNPEIEPGSPALQADSLPSEPPGKPHICHRCYRKRISENDQPKKKEWK